MSEPLSDSEAFPPSTSQDSNGFDTFNTDALDGGLVFDPSGGYVQAGGFGTAMGWGVQAVAATRGQEQLREIYQLQDNILQLRMGPEWKGPTTSFSSIAQGLIHHDWQATGHVLVDQHHNQTRADHLQIPTSTPIDEATNLYESDAGVQNFPESIPSLSLYPWLVDTRSTAGPSSHHHSNNGPQTENTFGWKLSNPNNPNSWVLNPTIPQQYLVTGSTREVVNIDDPRLNSIIKPMPYPGEYLPGNVEFLQVPDFWSFPLTRGPYWKFFLGNRLLPNAPYITNFKDVLAKAKSVGNWTANHLAPQAQVSAERYLRSQILMNGLFMADSRATELAVNTLRLCETFSGPSEGVRTVESSHSVGALLAAVTDSVRLTCKEVFAQSYFDFGIGATAVKSFVDGGELIANKIADIRSHHYWCYRHVETMGGVVEAKFVDSRIDTVIVKLMLTMPNSSMVWFEHNPLTTPEEFNIPYPLIAFAIHFLEWGCAQVKGTAYFGEKWMQQKPKGAVILGKRRRPDVSGGDPAAPHLSLEDKLREAFTQDRWHEMHQVRFFHLFRQIKGTLYLST
ncbi:hypothetical protein BDN67DRAFT_1015187 [Paxillus ammoniavirescens]|nr:hypothetical protein BDN67DRAFT_1015187 [Paxillus ammoniavirescens]